MQNLSVLKQVGKEKELSWAQEVITSGFDGELSKWLLRAATRTHMALGARPSFAGCSDPDSGVDERTVDRKVMGWASAQSWLYAPELL